MKKYLWPHFILLSCNCRGMNDLMGYRLPYTLPAKCSTTLSENSSLTPLLQLSCPRLMKKEKMIQQPGSPSKSQFFIEQGMGWAWGLPYNGERLTGSLILFHVAYLMGPHWILFLSAHNSLMAPALLKKRPTSLKQQGRFCMTLATLLS